MANLKETIINIKNRKASHEYQFLDIYQAGIMLSGTEIKSIRDSKVSLSDAFCVFINEELFVRNMHIAEYKEGTYNNHEPKRLRKLLLHRKELNKLAVKGKEKGLTIVVLRVFINDRGFAKVEIALAKGKKLYDKRQDLTSKDAAREMNRVKA
jgi:SsrA-binding protein